MDRLKGKVATITGAGSGIGEATAIRFAQEGARVCVCDINGDAAARVTGLIRAAGGDAMAITADVGQEDQVAAMIQQTIDTYGRIDILYNNALNNKDSYDPTEQDFLQFNTDVFNRIIKVNVLGGVLASKYAIPHMIAQGGGNILFTSSTSGMGGDVGQFSYGASKAMVDWYVKTIATSFGKQGIRCNGIAPGIIQTPAVKQWATEEMKAAFLEINQVPRLGEPEDIAAMAVFLASDEAGYVTGHTYLCDGGMTTPLPFVQLQRAQQARDQREQASS